MVERKVILVRHGQEDVACRVDEMGGPLTKMGVEQAQLTGVRLASLPVDRIVSSSLYRAAQTADIVGDMFPDHTVEPTELLWEGMPSIPPGYGHMFQNRPATDQLQKDQLRLAEAYDHYFNEVPTQDSTEILVCHGNIIRYFATRILDVSVHKWIHMDLHNCSLSVVSLVPEEPPKLLALNDVGHLPIHLQTFV